MIWKCLPEVSGCWVEGYGCGAKMFVAGCCSWKARSADMKRPSCWLCMADSVTAAMQSQSFEASLQHLLFSCSFQPPSSHADSDT